MSRPAVAQAKPVQITEPAELVRQLGGSKAVAERLGMSAGGVRMWAARGSVPYRRLHRLRPLLARRRLRYTGPGAQP